MSVFIMMAVASHVKAADWLKVHDGKTYNISGMALLEQKGLENIFIVVHDNKKPKEPRIGMVRTSGNTVKYEALEWPAKEAKDWPMDLEAISTIPEQPEKFMALTSDGLLYVLSIEGKQVMLLDQFTLPKLLSNMNFEGLSIQKFNGQCVIAWGHRGAGPEPGILFWSTLDLQTKKFGPVRLLSIEVDYPDPKDPNTRHISDLKIYNDGSVFASAANDPGDQGPFVSSYVELGQWLCNKAGHLNFMLFPFYKATDHYEKKIEAIEILKTSRGDTELILATDDEDAGAWLYSHQLQNAPSDHRSKTNQTVKRENQKKPTRAKND